MILFLEGGANENGEDIENLTSAGVQSSTNQRTVLSRQGLKIFPPFRLVPRQSLYWEYLFKYDTTAVNY